MFSLLIKKGGLLLAGIFLLCSSEGVNWVYGQSNSAYTEVSWREPKIEIIDGSFELGIGAKFFVQIKGILDAKNIQVRIFRGNREKLSERKPLPNEDCVTFSSVVHKPKRKNGHFEWGKATSLWLALRENGDTEDLSEQDYFVRFEFQENNISGGSLKFHKEAIEQYFGEESAGFTITVVPRLDERVPPENKIKQWISEIKKWQEERRKEVASPVGCIKFVQSHNEENLKVAKVFKCHELKT